MLPNCGKKNEGISKRQFHETMLYSEKLAGKQRVKAMKLL